MVYRGFRDEGPAQLKEMFEEYKPNRDLKS